MTTIIRIAEDKEIEGLKALVKEIYLNAYENPEHYEGLSSLWLVAERDGRIIGCINLDKPNGKEYPVIAVLVVKPEYQNGVIGVRLLKMAERLYQWGNAPGYIFCVRKDNQRMRKLSDKYAVLYREDPDNLHLYYGVDFHGEKTTQT